MTFFERYFFKPNAAMKLLSLALLPFSAVFWAASMARAFRHPKSTAKNLGIRVVSVGNLVLGGSGKTPFVCALYEHFAPRVRTFIVLRGYGRKSRGTLVVARGGGALVGVDESGDEAALYARAGAHVIVSESREAGIARARELGARLVLLDDGFRQFGVRKFDVVLRPFLPPANDFCAPSGAYRVAKRLESRADLIVEFGELAREFRIVALEDALGAGGEKNAENALNSNLAQNVAQSAGENLLKSDENLAQNGDGAGQNLASGAGQNFATISPKFSQNTAQNPAQNPAKNADEIGQSPAQKTPAFAPNSNLDYLPAQDLLKWAQSASLPRLVLVSGVANPSRLAAFYPLCVGAKHLPDHADFTAAQLAQIAQDAGADGLLVTQKDAVKIAALAGLETSVFVLQMRTKIPPKIVEKIENYVYEKDEK